jgi:hypothetical protein
MRGRGAQARSCPSPSDKIRFLALDTCELLELGERDGLGPLDGDPEGSIPDKLVRKGRERKGKDEDEKEGASELLAARQSRKKERADLGIGKLSPGCMLRWLRAKENKDVSIQTSSPRREKKGKQDHIPREIPKMTV